MNFFHVFIAGIILVSACGAMAFRNLIHCALCLVVTFAGLAVFYLGLGAEFVGLVQLLVYVGAVAILIVFAILLTHGGNADPAVLGSWPARLAGIGSALLVFGSLAAAVSSSAIPNRPELVQPELTVRQVGERLLHDHVLALEVIGLLLTAALIGAVVIALNETSPPEVSGPSTDTGRDLPGGAGGVEGGARS